jgi:hypothetical protein
VVRRDVVRLVPRLESRTPTGPSPSRRITSREDAQLWVKERRQTLTALTAHDEQLLLEKAA